MQKMRAGIGSYYLRSCYTNAGAIPISPVTMMSVTVMNQNISHIAETWISVRLLWFSERMRYV